MIEIKKHYDDPLAQRQGYDASVFIAGGGVFLVEEKVRAGWPRPDILLELISNDETGSAGWLLKPTAAHLYLYAWIGGTPVCGYFLPTRLLRRAWDLFGREWRREYKEYAARNSRRDGSFAYNTINIAIPTPKLLEAMTYAMYSSSTPETQSGHEPARSYSVEPVQQQLIFA